jgi:hypothetical protein
MLLVSVILALHDAERVAADANHSFVSSYLRFFVVEAVGP